MEEMYKQTLTLCVRYTNISIPIEKKRHKERVFLFLKKDPKQIRQNVNTC